MSPIVLGVETSCDETSAAVLEAPRTLLGHVVLSQDGHAVYGGVVPEIAARAHLAVLDDVVDGALRQAGLALERVDLVGATTGPGLIGALLVGLTWGRSVAFAWGLPFIGVHHMEAHLFATAIDDPAAEPPFVALLVSGGHTLLLTVDSIPRDITLDLMEVRVIVPIRPVVPDTATAAPAPGDGVAPLE